MVVPPPHIEPMKEDRDDSVPTTPIDADTETGESPEAIKEPAS